MKAALMREYHRPLELVDVAAPEPAGPSDALVRVAGAGVCATDLHALDGLMEPAGVTLPRVLGHENAGWMHAVGDGVSTVVPGDAVLVYPPHSCGLCVACRRGDDMHCARHEFTGPMVVDEHAIVGNLVGSRVELWEPLELHAARRFALRIERHPLESVDDVLGALRDGDVAERAVLVPA